MYANVMALVVALGLTIPILINNVPIYVYDDAPWEGGLGVTCTIKSARHPLCAGIDGPHIRIYTEHIDSTAKMAHVVAHEQFHARFPLPLGRCDFDSCEDPNNEAHAHRYACNTVWIDEWCDVWYGDIRDANYD